MTYNTYTGKDSVKIKNAAAGADTAIGSAETRNNSIDAEVGKRSAERSKVKSSDPSALKNKRSQNKEVAVSRLPAFIGLAQKKKIETIKVNTVKKYPLAIAIIIMISITSMFMYIVVSAVGVNELKMRSTEMNNELESLIKQYDELSLEVEKRDNLRFIEELAVNQYGMINKEYVTKHYINMQKEDKIEVMDGKGSLDSSSDRSASESVPD